MIKKIIVLILAMMLMMTACMAEGTSHTHAPLEAWDRDLNNHWHNCECGEALEAEAHAGDGEDVFVCEVCGSEVWNYGDGSGTVTDYNEYWDVVRYSGYEEGVLTDENVYVIEYDADGNRLREETYWNGVLYEEGVYTVGPEGYSILAAWTSYADDGSRNVIEYDENMNLVSCINYDADGMKIGEETCEYDEYGNLVHRLCLDENGAMFREETIEYTYDEEGNMLAGRSILLFEDSSSMVHETNEYGDTMLGAFYDANGALEAGWNYEYEYDEDGCMNWKKQYDVTNGRLLELCEYAVYEDEYGEDHYEKTCTSYEEDGSVTVCEYDHHGNELSVITRDAEGEIVYTRRGEYEYDEDDVLVLEKYYENDRLYLIVENAMEETEDWVCGYMKSRTEINEDGTMYIWEYDVDGNEISYGLYDEEGNLIPESKDAE